MAVLYRNPHYSEACYNEIELYLMIYVFEPIISLCKQCRPRSDSSFRSSQIRVYKLFVIFSVSFQRITLRLNILFN